VSAKLGRCVVVWRVPSIDGARPRQLYLRGNLLVALYVPLDRVRL
jgi:hypothetical protein